MNVLTCLHRKIKVITPRHRRLNLTILVTDAAGTTTRLVGTT